MKVELKITRMHCNGCVENVRKALEATDGVASATVDLKKKTAAVEYSAPADEDALVKAVESAGFEAKVKHGLFS
jgi:P-type Cu+ transporter